MTKASIILKLEELFKLDLRSLALFRVSLALLVLTDLVQRAQDLTAHYTDFGILPRAPLIEIYLYSWLWSLHVLNGTTIFQTFLFIFAGAVALALLFGYKTRFATTLTWILLVSLQNRNPLILHGGDVELRLLLFWGIFLPLGAYYSVDSALNSSQKPLPKSIFSDATVAITLQICMIYWFAWAHKYHPIWREEGSAVYYALNIDTYVTSFGHFLLKFPPLLVFLNFATLGIELLAPFLLFVPFKNAFFRCFVVVLFILLHIGFGLVFRLELFPFISSVAWLVFLPSKFWNIISRRSQFLPNHRIRIYYNGDRDFLKKSFCLLRTFLLLPNVTLLPAQDTPEISLMLNKKKSWFLVESQEHKRFKYKAIIYLIRYSFLFQYIAPLFKWRSGGFLIMKAYEIIAKNYRIIAKIISYLEFRPFQVRSSFEFNLVSFCLACVLWWNLNGIAPSVFEVTQDVHGIVSVLRLDQQWSMFAPIPLLEDGWYVIVGKLKDETEVDLLRDGEAVNWRKPDQIWKLKFYSNVHWVKYLESLWLRKNAPYRPYYVQYLCRKWNTQYKGSKQLNYVELYYILEKTPPNYQTPNLKKVLLLEQYCSNPSVHSNMKN
jgi:hypothetical protein